MREGGKKKHLRKKNIESMFGDVIEGDQMKKTLDKLLEKLTVMLPIFFRVFLFIWSWNCWRNFQLQMTKNSYFYE